MDALRMLSTLSSIFLVRFRNGKNIKFELKSYCSYGDKLWCSYLLQAAWHCMCALIHMSIDVILDVVPSISTSC